MATAREIERLLIRLIGDGSSYSEVLERAVAETQAASSSIEAHTKKVQQKQAAVMREAAQITESVATPTERYNKQLGRLSAHLANGSITQETYNRAVRQAGAELDKAHAASAKFQNEIIQAELVTSRAAESMQRLGSNVRSFGHSVRSFGTSWSLYVTAPLTGFLVASAASAIRLDSLKMALNAITGDSKETEIQFARLREVAKLPGLGFSEAVEGSVALQSAGFSARLAERALMGFGNALATVGKGKNELDKINLALTQIVGKGELRAQELNQIAEHLPQIRGILQRAFGTTDTEAIQALGLDVEDFFEIVITELEKLPQMTGGARNTLENMADAAFLSLSKFGDAVLRVFLPVIEQLSSMLTYAADAFSTLSPAIQSATVVFVALVAVIGPILIGLGMLIALVGAVITAIGTIGTVVSAIGAPVLAVIALIAAGIVVFAAEVAALAYLFIGPEGLSAIFTAFMETAKNVVMKVIGFFYNFRENMSILFNWLDKKFFGIPGFIASSFKKVITVVRQDVMAMLEILVRGFKVVANFLSKFIDLPDFNFDLPTFESEAPDISAGGAGVDLQQIEAQKQLEAEARQLAKDVDELTSKLWEQVDTYGMATQEAEIYKLSQRGASEATLEQARALSEQLDQLERQSEIDKFTDSLRTQLETYGMASREIGIYKLQKEGATEAQLKEARAIDQALSFLDAEKKAFEERNKLFQEGKRVADQFLTPQEKFIRQQEDLNRLLAVGAINRITFDRAMKGARDELQKLEDQATIKVKFALDNEAVRAGTSEFRQLIAETANRVAARPRGVFEPVDVGRVDVKPGGGFSLEPLTAPLLRIAEATEASASKESVTLEPAELDV